MPAEQFETSDGHFLVINATTQPAFERLCAAMGRPELAADDRFRPRPNLLKHYAEIHAIVAEWVAPLTLAECQAQLDEHGVPATKVNELSDIVSDPHFAAREQVLSVESDDYGHLLQPGIVPKLSETPGAVRSRAPRLGEHNEEVYIDELGLDQAEFDRLREAHII